MPPSVATAKRTRRSRAADASDAAAADTAVMDLPENGAEIIPPLDPLEMEFFQYLNALTAAQWDDRLVYLYRQSPEVRNAAGNRKFIDKISHVFDEAFVKEKHGGGTYLAIVKNTRDNQSERSHSFSIDGQPKFIEGQTLANPAAAAPGAAVPSGSGAVAPAHMDENAIANIVRTVVTAMQQNQSPDAAGAAMKNAMEIMAMGSKAALEQVVTNNKAQAGSSTGNPMLDKLLTAAIDNLSKPREEQSLKDRLHELKTLREIISPDAGEEKSGVLDKIGEIKDSIIAAVGSTGRKADLATGLLTNAPIIAKTLGDAIGSWKEVELAKTHVAALNAQARLLHLQRGGTMTELIAAAQVGSQPPAGTVQYAPQPGTNGASAPAGIAPSINSAPLPPEFAAAGQPPVQEQPLSEEERMGMFLEFIVDQFESGSSGDGTVQLLRKRYPGVIEQYAAMLSNKDQVLAFAMSNPILQPIADDEDFPEFVEHFVAEIQGKPIA